jgi:hypothetical protein
MGSGAAALFQTATRNRLRISLNSMRHRPESAPLVDVSQICETYLALHRSTPFGLYASRRTVGTVPAMHQDFWDFDEPLELHAKFNGTLDLAAIDRFLSRLSPGEPITPTADEVDAVMAALI